MSAEEPSKYDDWELYRRLLTEAKPCWFHILVAFAISLLASPLALLTPLPLKIAVDSVLAEKPLPGFLAGVLPESVTTSQSAILFLCLFLMLAITLLSKLQEAGAYILTTYTGQRLVRGFRSRLFQHAQRVSLLYHDRKGASDSLYRIQYDAPSISQVALQGVTPFVTAIVTVVAMMYITWRIDPHIAFVAIGIIPLLLGVFVLYKKRLRSGARQIKEVQSGAFSVVQEVLGAVRVVKAFGQEDREQERFVQMANQGIRAQLRFACVDSGFSMLLGLILAAGTATALFIGVRHVQSEFVTLGELLMVMAYMGMLLGPLNRISRQAGSLQSQFASAERAFSLLDESPDVIERPGARSLDRASGDVCFRNVSFGYDESSPVLNAISFQVPPNARVGIAGRTGSGKTTLISLLLRFYDPTSGEILLDGVDIRDYRLADLRNQFAIVLQEPVLFSTSIYENIAYGRPEADREMVENAARLANAHDFIVAQPDGYDTQVGDRGMSLSGGERQRISLARAFLKDAPILVLDEPTSSVDVDTESSIMDALQRLMEGRTTFIIAHRLSTLEHSDIRFHLKNGRLVETQTLKDLSSETERTAAAAGVLE